MVHQIPSFECIITSIIIFLYSESFLSGNRVSDLVYLPLNRQSLFVLTLTREPLIIETIWLITYQEISQGKSCPTNDFASRNINDLNTPNSR